jgi:hypothetical protein
MSRSLSPAVPQLLFVRRFWISEIANLMHANVQKLNPSLPYCDAKTATDILVVFHPPASPSLHIGDVLEVDLFRLDCEQTVHNVSRGFSFPAVVKSNNVHDLKMRGGHGTSRFPSVERRSEVSPTPNATGTV